MMMREGWEVGMRSEKEARQNEMMKGLGSKHDSGRTRDENEITKGRCEGDEP